MGLQSDVVGSLPWFEIEGSKQGSTRVYQVDDYVLHTYCILDLPTI